VIQDGFMIDVCVGVSRCDGIYRQIDEERRPRFHYDDATQVFRQVLRHRGIQLYKSHVSEDSISSVRKSQRTLKEKDHVVLHEWLVFRMAHGLAHT